jgi:hypothetical protein
MGTFSSKMNSSVATNAANDAPDWAPLAFRFSAPGFEETMRCNSVPVNEKPTPLTPEQQKECPHLGHAVNASESQ